MSTDAELAGSIEIDEKPFVDSMKKAEDAWNKLGDTLKRGDGAFQDAAGKWRAANGQFMTDAEKAAAGIDGSFKKISSSAGAMSVVIGNLVAQAATNLASFASSAIMVGIRFDAMKEQATIAFTNLLGSGQAAKKFLDELAAFAARTPFEFKELTSAARRLTAMGFASRDVIPMLTAVGNAVAAMGGNAAMVDRVTTALVQMKAKGKVSAQEMMQLAEAGIPAWEILAKKIGVSIPEAMKLGEKGAISASVAIEGLIEGMNSKFGGMMEAQSQSFDGLMSTLRDLTSQAAGEIMQPIFDASKNVLQNIVKLLPEFKAQFVGAFNEIIVAVSGTVNRLAPLVVTAMNDIAATWRSGHSDILNVTKAVWTTISVGFIEPIVGGIAKLVSAGALAMAGNWEAALRRMLNITDTASNSMLGTVARWVQALARVSGIVSGLSGVTSALASAGAGGGGAKGANDGFWKTATDDMRAKSKALADEARIAGGNVAKALGAGIGGGAGAVKKGANEAAKALRETLQSINEWVSASGNGVRISEQAWANASPSMQKNIIALRDEFNRLKLQTEETFLALKGGLLSTIPGANVMFLELIKKARETGTIFAEHATPKTLEFIQANKGMATAVKAAAQDLDESNKKIAKSIADAAKSSQKALAAWGEFMSDAVKRVKDDIKNELGDGVGSVLVGLAEGLNLNVTNVLGWAKDIKAVVSVLPESFQHAVDKVLGTLDKWIKFGDGVLGILNRLGFEVPKNMGDLIQGMIKKMDFSGVLNKVKEFGSGFLKNLKSIFSSAAGMIAGGAALFGASFGVGGVGGKILGAGGGALMGAKIGSMIAPGIGTAIGAIGGAIFGGLFGGKKSKEQVEAEKRAKEQAALATQDLYNAVNQGIIETMNKGFDLLQKIQGFADVPLKAIKHFVNQLGFVLTTFVEMSKQFKAEGLAAGKAVVDNLGDAFNFLLSGADLINAIKTVTTITDQNITDFVATTMKIVEKWAEAANTIELGTAKFTGKIADKLTTSFEFLKIVPEVIKGFAESVAVDDSIIDRVFATASKFITKMKEMSEAQRGLELNKAGASAGIFSTIFEASKSMLEVFAQLAAYKPLEDSILDAITNDLKKLLAWGDGLIALGESGIAKFETLGSVIARMAAAMKGATAGISALAGGTSGIASSVRFQQGAPLLSFGGGESYVNRKAPAATATSQTTTVIHQNFQVTLSLKDLEELASAPDRLQRLERLMNEARSRTGGTALAYTSA